jgi:hypothetical protein
MCHHGHQDLATTRPERSRSKMIRVVSPYSCIHHSAAVQVENLGSSFGLRSLQMAPARVKKGPVLSAESRLSAPRNFRAQAATSASSEAKVTPAPHSRPETGAPA